MTDLFEGINVLSEIDIAPTNHLNKETTEHPVNWMVFTVRLGGKKQFVRIHPNCIFDTEDSYFNEDELDNFYDAWNFFADGEIEESRLEAVRPYVTFILNKVAHLYLESREAIVEKMQDGELILIDCYITNSQEQIMSREEITQKLEKLEAERDKLMDALKANKNNPYWYEDYGININSLDARIDSLKRQLEMIL